MEELQIEIFQPKKQNLLCSTTNDIIVVMTKATASICKADKHLNFYELRYYGNFRAGMKKF